MHQEQFTKLKAHVGHLLDLFLEVKETYAFLAPMLFDQAVIDKYGQREKARGFNAIKFSLFYACIQDLTKLEKDSDPRTPTIKCVLDALSDESVRNALRNEFVNSFNDPALTGMKIDRKKKEEEKHRRDFDDGYKSTLDCLAKISEELRNFKMMRDKVISHSELRKDGSEYKLLDVSTLELTFGSVGHVIGNLQEIICNLNRLVRSASFDFDAVQKNLDKARAAYWEV